MRKSDGKEQTVVMEWWGYSDNEEREYRFSVSIKEGDNLVGFASYERSDFINWSSSYGDATFTILNEEGLKTSLTGQPANGQVSAMMGSKEQAEGFLSLLERKVKKVTKNKELWNYRNGSPEEEVWTTFS